MKQEDKKPRVRFCWECGKQLRGNHFEAVELPYNNGNVIMHKQCAKEFRKEMGEPDNGRF